MSPALGLRARSVYVHVLRAVRTGLAAGGLLGPLDGLARRSRTALWVRSWLAVHDLDDLVALDVPWWTFEAADRVAAHLVQRPGARVLEWGSGASTVWLGARSAHVTSIEHDPGWARRVRDAVPANVDLRLVEPEPARGAGVVRSGKAGFAGLDFARYVAVVDDVEGLFDLVVIDGRAREACLDRAVGRLAPGGLVVFDNVDRARYREAIAAHPDLEVTWTRGRTPALPYPTRTALVSRRP